MKKLGVNCVELQPVHEFDNQTREEYQWGYMPANWFSPASGFALDGARGSQVKAAPAGARRRLPPPGHGGGD